MGKPIVAIVGRPNVGKSTLFNRLVGQRLAIVEGRPGTTRDRLYADTEWKGVEFTLVDTGGLDIVSSVQRQASVAATGFVSAVETFAPEVRHQAEIAIAEADVVVFLADVMDGVTPGDRDVADVLRRSAKPVILTANKADTAARRAEAVEFFALGLGDPLPISALHGVGIGDLLDKVVAMLPPVSIEEETQAVKVAIVGQPNVGKSSLLNAILGEERAIVSEIPGTTRDALDTQVMWRDQPIVLIDTAGMRRRGKIAPGVEQYSVLRALRAIQRSDVALLLLDAPAGVTAQDTHVGGYILEAGKSAVIVVNKWDLVEKDSNTLAEYTTYVRRQMNFLDYAPVLFVSAKTGQRVQQVLDTALRVRAQRAQRISTSALNKIVQDATSRHAPPSRAGKRLRFYYATQAQADPPTFVFFVNDARHVHFSYQRYLENRLREMFGFEGTPLKMVFRTRERS